MPLRSVATTRCNVAALSIGGLCLIAGSLIGAYVGDDWQEKLAHGVIASAFLLLACLGVLA